MVALTALGRPAVAERGAVLLTNLLSHERGREIIRYGFNSCDIFFISSNYSSWNNILPNLALTKTVT